MFAFCCASYQIDVKILDSVLFMENYHVYSAAFQLNFFTVERGNCHIQCTVSTRFESALQIGGSLAYCGLFFWTLFKLVIISIINYSMLSKAIDLNSGILYFLGCQLFFEPLKPFKTLEQLLSKIFWDVRFAFGSFILLAESCSYDVMQILLKH